jgi:hypothetical protein
MKIIDNLILKYIKFREKMRINRDKRWRKYFLSHYGAYHNADELTHKEMLDVFWKMLKYHGYYASNFNSNTNIEDPGKQFFDWEELGCEGFITELTQMFDLLREDLVKDRYICVKTFGELADLLIKKAKEKKLKQQEQERQ